MSQQYPQNNNGLAGRDPYKQLEPLVKSQIAAWTATAQSAAVVTTLFSGTSAQLLGVIRSDDGINTRTGPLMNLLLIASYAAILLNAISTLASLFLIDRLGDIDFNYAKSDGEEQHRSLLPLGTSSLKLLIDSGAEKNIKAIFLQWVLYLVLGAASIFTQALVYTWIRDQHAVSVSVTAISGLALIVLCVTYYIE